MKRILTVLSLLIILNQCNMRSNESAESNAKSLIEKMTLKEKTGQMTQLTIEMFSGYDITGAIMKPRVLYTNKLRQLIVEMGVGSIQNVSGYAYSQEHWKDNIGSIQTYSKSSCLQIPVLYGFDAIHGANYAVGETLYPQQISLTNTFNRCTQFTYKGIDISKRNLGVNDSVQMKVNMRNSGNFERNATILVYSSDKFASITPFIKRLRTFKRVHLNPSEKPTVPFVIAIKDLSFVGLKNQFELEPGKFLFTVSSLKNSIEIHS